MKPSHNLNRSGEWGNRFRWPALLPGIQSGVLAVFVMVVSGKAQIPAEKPKAQNEPSFPATIYDPDPNHLWNRLFVTFFRQKVSNFTGYSAGDPADKPVTHWIGPDVVDPPIGYQPEFLLDDEPFARGNSVLDEFLNQHGAGLMHEPLKRAVLQHDLWAVFDALNQANFRNSDLFPTLPPPSTPAQEQHRTILESKIARVIHSLALSRTEIINLPDTYAAAVRSGAFSDRPEAGRYNILPDDLFATNSAWFEVNPGNPRLRHSLLVGGRSVFRAFVKSPPGFTNVLGDRIRESEGWIQQYDSWAQLQQKNPAPARAKEPPRPEGLLPAGTQFLLLREMICLDENSQMAPTHIVESVQFRTTLSGQAFDREADLRRAWLFQDRQGGLRPIPAGEPTFVLYQSFGHLDIEPGRLALHQVPFPDNCGVCHPAQARALFSNAHTSSRPVRSTSIEAISQWKEEKGKLDQLRNFIHSPLPNEKFLLKATKS